MTDSLPPSECHSGAHMAERMPVVTMLCSDLKTASSSTFGRRIETCSLSTRREIERLTRRMGSPRRVLRGLHLRELGARGAFEQRDGAALGRHRGEEDVEDLVEGLGDGLVGEKRGGRAREHGEHAVLADEVFGAARRLEHAFLEGAHGEDAGAHRLDVVLGLLVGQAPLHGDGVVAELDLIALAQRRRALDARAVDQGAVLAPEIRDHEAAPVQQDLGVHAREPLVGNEDVGIARTAERGALAFDLDATFSFRRLEEQFGCGGHGKEAF